MLAKFVSLKSVAYRNTLLSQYKTIVISFERTGQTLNLDLETSIWRCPRGVVQNHRPPTSHRPQTTDHSDTYHRPPTTDHRPGTTDHRLPPTDQRNHRPPIWKTTDHWPMAVKKPTTDQKNNRPPTRSRLLSHWPEEQPTTEQITVVKPPTTDHTANMFYLLCDFSAIAILWYRVPHMNGADLNLPGESRVIKIGRTSILNNDSMVACGFLGIKCARFIYRSSRDSVKPTKRIAVNENKFWKGREKRYSSIKNTFDWMNLNEIERSKC